MMPLDSSIPLKVLNAGDLQKQMLATQSGQREQQLQPYKMQAAQQAVQGGDLDLAKKRVDITLNLISTAFDQPSYDRARQQAQQLGIDVSNVPQQFDPSYIQQAKMGLMTAKEQIESQILAATFGQKMPTTNPAAFGNPLSLTPFAPKVGGMPLGSPQGLNPTIPTGTNFTNALANPQPPVAGAPDFLTTLTGGGSSSPPLSSSPISKTNMSQPAFGGKPIYLNNLPADAKLPDNMQWVQNNDGSISMAPIAGSPGAKKQTKLDMSIMDAAKVLGDFQKSGMAIDPQRQPFAQNLANQVLNSGDVKIPFTGTELPGPKTIAQSTKRGEMLSNVDSAMMSLLQSMKQASGMSAQEINTIPELQLLEKSISGGSNVSVNVRRDALDRAARQLGFQSLDSFVQGHGGTQNPEHPFTNLPAGARVTRIK